MSSIRKLDDDTLMEVMKNFLNGDCFRVVEKEGAQDVKSLARTFIVWSIGRKFLGEPMDSIAD